ncbi:MAG TPA: ATP-binding cassette domain-containing protein, partial [Bacillota bacterium]|nr:ATP-binding cassette domain-containing protein [Bacillota bacterium]
AFFKIRGMKKRGTLQPFDLEVNAGEVLGLAGLLGSGRTEMTKLVYGIDRADGGGAELDGKAVTLSPRRAIEYGFGYCPEDRKQEGIIPDLSVRENIILALQAKAGWLKCFSRKKQEEIAEQFIKQLNIVTPNTEQAVKNLSGGNQQKVILARWLASNPRLLILDEPTRGIDIGAKTEIQKLVLTLCQKGMAIIFVSSELDEVVRCSHRVAVLRDRAKITELLDEQVDPQRIIQTIAGEVAECE